MIAPRDRVCTQLDDEFVKKHFSEQFASIEEMRKALIATTAMQRVQDMDKQLEDAVMNVSSRMVADW